MTELVVALLMIINGEIKEHRIQESKSHIKYQCIKSKAELETNIDGSLSIKKLILE